MNPTGHWRSAAHTLETPALYKKPRTRLKKKLFDWSSRTDYEIFSPRKKIFGTASKCGTIPFYKAHRKDGGSLLADKCYFWTGNNAVF
jgi:hypothetical protein